MYITHRNRRQKTTCFSHLNIRKHFSSYSDDTPLIRNEFLNEPHITAQSLGGDPLLGMANEDEHDSWSPKVGKEVLKSLNAKEVLFYYNEHLKADVNALFVSSD